MKKLILLLIGIFLLFIIPTLIGAQSNQIPTAEMALKKLKEGNLRFFQNNQKHPRQNQSRRKITSTNGQYPFATVLACSDSLIPVEKIFDAGIGDIFTIKIAGNIIDVDEAGSIEYGVNHLNTPLFVVLGHSQCGTVSTFCQQTEVHGNLPHLLDKITPAVKKSKEIHGSTFGKELLEASIKNNVWQSIEDLLRMSPSSVKLIQSGKLKVIGAIYHLTDGHIEWLGEHPNQITLVQNANKTIESITAITPNTISQKKHIPQKTKISIEETDEKISNHTIIIQILLLAGILLSIYLLTINQRTALKLKLKGKIFGVALSITCLLFVVAGINSYSLYGIGEALDNIANKDIILTEYTTEIEKHALEQEILIQKILSLTHESTYQNKTKIIATQRKFRELSKMIDQHLQESKQLCKNTIQHESNQVQIKELKKLYRHFKSIDNDHQDFEEQAENFFKMVNTNNTLQIQRMEDAFEEEAAQIGSHTEELLESMEEYTERSAQIALKHEPQAIATNYAISIIAILMALIPGLFTSNKIAKQLGAEPEEVAGSSEEMASQGKQLQKITTYFSLKQSDNAPLLNSEKRAKREEKKVLSKSTKPTGKIVRHPPIDLSSFTSEIKDFEKI